MISEAIIVSGVAALGSVLSTLISARALVESRKVGTAVKPVSNGFASGVNVKLDALGAHLVDLHSDVREVRATVVKHIVEGH